MYKEIRKAKTPKYLIITPLKEGDKISKETRETVNLNRLQFDWISYEANNNIPKNTQLALNEYEKLYKRVDYIIKIDNDINMQSKLLDHMFNYLKKSKDNIAYVYCPFSYILDNGQYISFKGKFDVERLIHQNWISSNSMIKRESLERVGGFVIDSQYERLLDWCLWLKFAYYNLSGMMIDSKSFTTPLNKNNVSARGEEDYKVKFRRVRRDFCIPLDRKIFKNNL